MRRAILTTSVLLSLSLAAEARAWNREYAFPFAVLPAGAGGPEGLEIDPQGNVYVGSFGWTAKAELSPPGHIYVFDGGGRLVRDLHVDLGSAHLLGLKWRPSTGSLLVADLGSAQVLDVDPKTGHATVFMTLPNPLPNPTLGSGLNDITFDAAGNVYVSDSFQGIIWRTGPAGGTATAWVEHALLRTSGVPPFGANGLRFNSDESALFVANTGDDAVIKVPVAGGVPGTPAVFVNGINGADGLVIDEHDNLWVAANQADEIVVVDPSGRAIAKLGDFGGVARGIPRQLLFPASLRLRGGWVFVTNLALDLRLFKLPPSVDSAWCAQVTRYTVSVLPARIPPLAPAWWEWP